MLITLCTQCIMSRIRSDGIVDIFPARISLNVSKLSHPGSTKNFKLIFGNQKVQLSIPVIINNTLFYKLKEWNLKRIDHFAKTGHASTIVNEFKPEQVSWNYVKRQLREKTEENQKNANVRFCFHYDNIFLVKAFFTFGQRRAEPGKWHIYQTSHAPMLFYVLRSGKRISKEFDRNKAFCVADQSKYDSCILQPISRYKVTSDYVYVILTLQKTLFSLDVVKEGTFLPFECQDPREFKFNGRPPSSEKKTNPQLSSNEDRLVSFNTKNKSTDDSVMDLERFYSTFDLPSTVSDVNESEWEGFYNELSSGIV